MWESPGVENLVDIYILARALLSFFIGEGGEIDNNVWLFECNECLVNHHNNIS